MRYDPDIHHRRSIRLRGYDYAKAGVYFVTVCVQDRECMFGEIADGCMQLNQAGTLAENLWCSLPERFQSVKVDSHVVMPNHVHGIIVLAQALSEVKLGEVIRVFKASVTQNLRHSGLSSFRWQRNYYERIIRSEAELNAVRTYISNNPANWNQDSENPAL